MASKYFRMYESTEDALAPLRSYQRDLWEQIEETRRSSHYHGFPSTVCNTFIHFQLIFAFARTDESFGLGDEAPKISFLTPTDISTIEKPKQVLMLIYR